MNPKKINNKLPEIAKDLELSEELVEDVFDFFWSDVRKTIGSAEHHRVNIESFGLFHVRRRALRRNIYNYEKILEGTDSTKFSKYPKYLYVSERLEKLKKLYQALEDEIEDSKTFKKNRDE